MGSLFSLRWWANTFLITLITMIFIYFIKVASSKYNIPFVKDVAETV